RKKEDKRGGRRRQKKKKRKGGSRKKRRVSVHVTMSAVHGGWVAKRPASSRGRGKSNEQRGRKLGVLIL
ncbi:unnamed protein product, partial [Musa textilis]